jgi:hypothetical protein
MRGYYLSWLGPERHWPWWELAFYLLARPLWRRWRVWKITRPSPWSRRMAKMTQAERAAHIGAVVDRAFGHSITAVDRF